MRASPALLTIETPQERSPLCVDDMIRSLVRVVGGSLPHVYTCSSTDNSYAEEILVDAEVDGNRYLLIRMSRPAPGRIQLSPREQEIVRMVAKGHPNKVIAGVLNISSWTVCTHLRRIFAKLGVGSRAAMVARLLEMGALTSDRVPSDAR